MRRNSSTPEQHPATLAARNQQFDDLHRSGRDAQHSLSHPFDHADALITQHDWLRHAVHLVALAKTVQQIPAVATRIRILSSRISSKSSSSIEAG
jgi:hypothetical protein